MLLRTYSVIALISCLLGSMLYAEEEEDRVSLLEGVKQLPVTGAPGGISVIGPGAFAVIAYFPEKQVEFSAGAPKTFEHRSDESKRWLRIEFCARCGTTVAHTAEVFPGLRAIAGGTFDDRAWFKIERHAWTRSACPWVVVPEGVEIFAKGSVASVQKAP